VGSNSAVDGRSYHSNILRGGASELLPLPLSDVELDKLDSRVSQAANNNPTDANRIKAAFRLLKDISNSSIKIITLTDLKPISFW
jgi:hypothetical protein